MNAFIEKIKEKTTTENIITVLNLHYCNLLLTTLLQSTFGIIENALCVPTDTYQIHTTIVVAKYIPKRNSHMAEYRVSEKEAIEKDENNLDKATLLKDTPEFIKGEAEN